MRPEGFFSSSSTGRRCQAAVGLSAIRRPGLPEGHSIALPCAAHSGDSEGLTSRIGGGWVVVESTETERRRKFLQRQAASLYFRLVGRSVRGAYRIRPGVEGQTPIFFSTPKSNKSSQPQPGIFSVYPLLSFSSHHIDFQSTIPQK